MSARSLMEPTIRLGVTVSFLRMDRPPIEPLPALPAGVTIRHVVKPAVDFYRSLYDGVGREYCWWLRRTIPDAALAALLGDPLVELHVLFVDDAPAGFAELDRRPTPEVNLSYFGLMPHAVGRGLGQMFLRHAVDLAWSPGQPAATGRVGARPRGMTVNTCTADHPRALPNYLLAGFTLVRRVYEVWDVPTRLGLPIPEALRV